MSAENGEKFRCLATFPMAPASQKETIFYFNFQQEHIFFFEKLAAQRRRSEKRGTAQ